LTAEVLFTVNSKAEIVVISVDTGDSDLESFVKGKLNYKKVQLEEVVVGRMYRLPVRIKA
jgi:ribosomal protein L7Ae-like RNA K-turn-binding protein